MEGAGRGLVGSRSDMSNGLLDRLVLVMGLGLGLRALVGLREDGSGPAVCGKE